MKKMFLIFILFYFSKTYCFRPYTNPFITYANAFIIRDETTKKLVHLLGFDSFDEAIKLINDNSVIDFSIEVTAEKATYSILYLMIRNFEFLGEMKNFDKEIELVKLLIDRNKFSNNLICYQKLKDSLPD